MFAAAAGYTSGLLLHWLVSSRKVFSNKLAGPGSSRRQQQALFFASALVGLATTVGIIRMGELAHLNPLLPKLVAIGVSFQITYILRKIFVFA
jgi:putative flippase GtrA